MLEQESQIVYYLKDQGYSRNIILETCKDEALHLNENFVRMALAAYDYREKEYLKNSNMGLKKATQENKLEKISISKKFETYFNDAKIMEAITAPFMFLEGSIEGLFAFPTCFSSRILQKENDIARAVGRRLGIISISLFPGFVYPSLFNYDKKLGFIVLGTQIGTNVISGIYEFIKRKRTSPKTL